MVMDATPQAQLAVLIDADNANAKRIDSLLAEVAKYGRATTKRAYGDWTTQNLGSWKQVLARHAIQPMQQFSNTRGKNSTDSALIIDAMDLLYTERFDGFCIVSSDSDFTRLASRIRESGLTVYGFGERKTPQPFVRACDRFIYVEVLRAGAEEGAEAAAAKPPEKRREPAPPTNANRNAATPPKPAEKPEPAAGERSTAKVSAIDDPALLAHLSAAVADAGNEDGWAGLGAIGSLLSKRLPEFDPRNYGHRKLSDLVSAIPLFEFEERGEPGRSRAMYLREKRQREAAAAAPVAVSPAPQRSEPPALAPRRDARVKPAPAAEPADALTAAPPEAVAAPQTEVPVEAASSTPPEAAAGAPAEAPRRRRSRARKPATKKADQADGEDRAETGAETGE